MERRQEYLLQQLETEGKKIAKYRKRLSDLKCSDKTIQYSEIIQTNAQLNVHISSFDKIHHELVELEAVI